MVTVALILGGAAATVGGMHALRRFAKPGSVAERVYKVMGGGGSGPILPK